MKLNKFFFSLFAILILLGLFFFFFFRVAQAQVLNLSLQEQSAALNLHNGISLDTELNLLSGGNLSLLHLELLDSGLAQLSAKSLSGEVNLLGADLNDNLLALNSQLLDSNLSI